MVDDVLELDEVGSFVLVRTATHCTLRQKLARDVRKIYLLIYNMLYAQIEYFTSSLPFIAQTFLSRQQRGGGGGWFLRGGGGFGF